MRWLILILAIFAASQSFAASPIVRDGGTIDLADVTYRLDGIDAPALDQICIDDHADTWACGVDARDRLASLIGGHEVRCEDLGPDATYKKWHVGVCTVEGENQQPEPTPCQPGTCLEFRTLCTRPLQGG